MRLTALSPSLPIQKKDHGLAPPKAIRAYAHVSGSYDADSHVCFHKLVCIGFLPFPRQVPKRPNYSAPKPTPWPGSVWSALHATVRTAFAGEGFPARLTIGSVLSLLQVPTFW
jgi:hypothetical protein